MAEGVKGDEDVDEEDADVEDADEEDADEEVQGEAGEQLQLRHSMGESSTSDSRVLVT